MAAVSNRLKSERVQLRIDQQSKRLLEQAAGLANMSVSSFVAACALEAATRLIQERQRLVVSSEEWDHFLKVLAEPPEPADALRRALAAHERLQV